jgi:tetratricopeptide (TPR) repeat protein
VEKALGLERRALMLDPDLADAHVWMGAALLALDRTDEAISAIEEGIRLEPDNGQAHQGLARALWVGKGDFARAIPEFERAIELNPEAGYSYLQLGLLLAWEGDYSRAEDVCRRAVELQDQYISGNAGLQVVGADVRLGYVYYLQGRYDEALREYQRGLAFVASGDHALKDRTAIEVNAKMGAAYWRQGRTEEATRHFERAVRMFDSLVAKGADDPFTRYYIAAVHALTGASDRAFDSLERVATQLPALTIARMHRDPDLASLQNDPRFTALISRFAVA